MLEIRVPQFKEFQKASRKRFEDAMLEYLREQFAAQVKSISDGELRMLIENAIDRAKVYKVLMEDDLRRYLECTMVYGQDFDSNPLCKWAGVALRSPNLTGTEKMDFIEKQRKMTL